MYDSCALAWVRKIKQTQGEPRFHKPLPCSLCSPPSSPLLSSSLSSALLQSPPCSPPASPLLSFGLPPAAGSHWDKCLFLKAESQHRLPNGCHDCWTTARVYRPGLQERQSESLFLTHFDSPWLSTYIKKDSSSNCTTLLNPFPEGRSPMPSGNKLKLDIVVTIDLACFYQAVERSCISFKHVWSLQTLKCC